MSIIRNAFILANFVFAIGTFGAAAPPPPDLSKLPPPSTKTGLTYAKDIRPILESTCFECHTDKERPARGGLHLDTLAGIRAGGDDGDVIVPGKSAQSLLVVAASRIDPESAMPPPPKKAATNAPAAPRAGTATARAGGPTSATAPAGTRPGAPARPGQPAPAPAVSPVRGTPAIAAAASTNAAPEPKPLTSEQVGLIRAWIDQGAK